MPIYEFRCSRCGDDFELLVRNTQMTCACPNCGSAELQKKFSVFGFKSAGDGAKSSSCCGKCSGHNCSGCHH